MTTISWEMAAELQRIAEAEKAGESVATIQPYPLPETVSVVYGPAPPIDLTDPRIIVEGRPALPDWVTPVAIGGAAILAVLFLAR